jgi:hypothetical protein
MSDRRRREVERRLCGEGRRWVCLERGCGNRWVMRGWMVSVEEGCS